MQRHATKPLELPDQSYCAKIWNINATWTRNKPLPPRFLPFERVAEQQPNRTVRLVDGPYVHEGIVQVIVARWL